MTARQRILTLRLLEKQKFHPEFMKKLGIEINIKNNKKVLEPCPWVHDIIKLQEGQ